MEQTVGEVFIDLTAAYLHAFSEYFVIRQKLYMSLQSQIEHLLFPVYEIPHHGGLMEYREFTLIKNHLLNSPFFYESLCNRKNLFELPDGNIAGCGGYQEGWLL